MTNNTSHLTNRDLPPVLRGLRSNWPSDLGWRNHRPNWAFNNDLATRAQRADRRDAAKAAEKQRRNALVADAMLADLLK